MIEKKILLDTNILLSNPEILDKNPEKYVLCLTTLRELDKLKRNPELNYPVRSAIKCIKRNLSNLEIDINEKITLDDLTNDEKIIEVAKRKNLKFRTEDIGAMVLAKLEQIEIDDENIVTEDGIDLSYKGYIEEEIEDITEWNVLYHNAKIDEDLIIEKGHELLINQYKVLINKKDKEEYLILFKNSDEDILQVPLKKYKKAIENIGIKIKPLDAYQWILIDAILNETCPIVIIDGILGTGKTLLSLIGALIQVKSNDNFFKKYETIYLTRPPFALSKKYEMGFLPGELEEKLYPWLLGFKSNLEFLYDTTPEDKEQQKAANIFAKYFKPVSLEHIQGASIHNSIILVDEYQLLDRDMSNQLLSRVSSGSKIVLIGDPEGQSYNMNRGNEGFKELRKHVKNEKLLSYIKLEKIYRSELAEFVAKIFKKY